MAHLPEDISSRGRPVARFEPIGLPTGHFDLSPESDDRLRSLSGATPRDGSMAHPIFCFVAGIGGMGVPVAEAIARGGCSIEAGPLLASCTISCHRPMKVGLTYQVDAMIADKVRKESRRFGAADHLLFRLALSSGGTKYVDLELRMIVPAGTI